MPQVSRGPGRAQLVVGMSSEAVREGVRRKSPGDARRPSRCRLLSGEGVRGRVSASGPEREVRRRKTGRSRVSMTTPLSGKRRFPGRERPGAGSDRRLQTRGTGGKYLPPRVMR